MQFWTSVEPGERKLWRDIIQCWNKSEPAECLQVKKKERDKEEMISYAVKKKKNVLAHFLILPVFNFSEIDCQQPQFIGIHGKES